ncbi:MAG: type II toxin-antitoxin system VapC family toxin [Desulfurococcaceae archaeon]|nr:type II toxin-antitoxin system VapC family toxin [Desulfurococcaceae archaeon]
MFCPYLDLTKYEIGNVIWKEFKKNKIKDLLVVLQMFKEILSEINELSINKDLDEVEKISIENNMTFYDASYIYIARKHRLKIVTEDKDLLKFKESMDIATLRREIFSHQ